LALFCTVAARLQEAMARRPVPDPCHCDERSEEAISILRIGFVLQVAYTYSFAASPFAESSYARRCFRTLALFCTIFRAVPSPAEPAEKSLG
jgi:hypothetical protein